MLILHLENMNEPIEIFNLEYPTITKIEDLKSEFYESRKGRFTGSSGKILMGCTRASSKMEWGRVEKIIDFSDTALAYVFAKAKERQRNKVIRTASSAAMNYGSNQESNVKEILRQRGYEIKDTKFIEFISGVAGASPDGYIEKNNLALEIKCSTDWNGLFSRHENPFDESHQDFWQINFECLSLKTDKCLYVVAEPSENIFEPNITDISEKIVEASEIHQKCIIYRCLIANEIIKLFLNGMNFREAARVACSNYEF